MAEHSVLISTPLSSFLSAPQCILCRSSRVLRSPQQILYSSTPASVPAFRFDLASRLSSSFLQRNLHLQRSLDQVMADQFAGRLSLPLHPNFPGQGTGDSGNGRRRRAGKAQASGGNTFGTLFRVTTFGESHGGGVGCVIDGCPPRLPLSESDMQKDLDRRRPGQSRITTPRKETDTCCILSGVADGVTLGTPIAVLVPNTDQRGGDYAEMAVAYRPSHADATYDFKYGVRAVQGGGRSSARETIGRVAAGAVAKKLLNLYSGTEVLAFVSRVHTVELPEDSVDASSLTLEQIESNIVRCPDADVAEEMIRAIDDVRIRGDSCGGVVTCIVRNVPKGLGSPVFDKLEAELAKALMSLPATKGFEIGSGFNGTLMLGSEHNDEFYVDGQGDVRTRTNRSGGIQGGISNGEDIVMRIAFKPTSTITRSQRTVTRDGQETELRARGRHDPCVVPRAVPMVEAMAALVLADQLLQHFAQCKILPNEQQLQLPVHDPKLEHSPV